MKIMYKKLIAYTDPIQSFFSFIERVQELPPGNEPYWRSEIASHMDVVVRDSEDQSRLSVLEGDNRSGLLPYVGILTRFHDIGKVKGKSEHESKSAQLILQNRDINRRFREMIESVSKSDTSRFGRMELNYKVQLFALIIKYHTFMTTGLTGEYSLKALDSIREELKPLWLVYGGDVFRDFIEGLYFLGYFDRGSKMRYETNWINRLRELREVCEEYDGTSVDYDFADRLARMILFQVPTASIADINRLAMLLRESGVVNFPNLARILKYGYAAGLMERVSSKKYSNKDRLIEFFDHGEQDFMFDTRLIKPFSEVEDSMRRAGLNPEKVSLLFRNWDKLTLDEDADIFLTGRYKIEIDDETVIIKKSN